MLAVSPFRDENQREVEVFSIGGDDFPEFGDGNLLDSIDFDDFFSNINDGDILPDLEMDPDILADFSATSTVGEESDQFNNTSVSIEEKSIEEENNGKKVHEDDKDSISRSGLISSSITRGNQDILSNKRDETTPAVNSTPKDANNNKGKKSSSSTAQSKNSSQGKRKVKVDWTPELHRRFVQAVEQLGVDKAVPSRILELMGIDCLTRHNIASHLQKYRSHRKHLLAREAEAASLNQRRQMYGSTGTGGVMRKRDMNPWIVPTTIGFPPPVTTMHPHFRPLHVWGHPTRVDQSLMHFPNNLPHSPSPPLPPTTWPPTLPPRPDPSYWHHPRVPNALNPGTPCFPQPLATTRYATAPVPGVPPPPHGMYKAVPSAQSGPHPLLDFQPSKESIDAAIGDVMSKPWLPLPLGLKPPSIDSVMGELHRQGVPKVPPSSINA